MTAVQGMAAPVSKATLTSKGQLTLPIDVRRALRLESGEGVTFEPAGEGAYLLRPAAAADLRRLRGIVAAPAKAVPLETMDAAIRRRVHAK